MMRRKRSTIIDPQKKSIARALFYLNAILWFVYTIYIYFDMAVLNQNELSADIVTIYVLVNAAAMFACGIILGKHRKSSFYFALIVVILNIMITLLNFSDLLFEVAFILDVIIVWMLLSLRAGYLSNHETSS